MKNKSISVILISLLLLSFLFCTVVHATQDDMSDEYLLGKADGYRAGLQEGCQSLKNIEEVEGILLSQIDVPEPSYVPEKSVQYQKGYKEGWQEGYKRGYEKGQEEGNEGYILGFLLGIFGVLIAFVM